MLGKIASRLAIFALNRSDLKIEDRNLLTNSILKTLAALPLRDILEFKADGSLLVRGTELDREQVRMLRESAKAALESRSLGLIRDEVLYKAFIFGLNKSVNNEQLLFAKAAVWWGQEEYNLLKALSSIGEGELGPNP